MAKIVIISDCKNSKTHEIMAAKALKKVAETLGHAAKVETTFYSNEQFKVSDDDVKQADVVIIAVDSQIDTKKLKGKFIYPTSISNAIIDTKTVIEDAIKLAGIEEKKESEFITDTDNVNIVAITACPTGIAHANMAAQALRKAADSLGYNIKIETQGLVGSKLPLTEEDIKKADLVIIASDIKVNLNRFRGKPIYTVSTNKAINDPIKVINNAFDKAKPYEEDINTTIQIIKEANVKKQSNFYKHLSMGVSFMIPLVVAGGFIMVLSYFFGLDAYREDDSIAQILKNIGNYSCLKLIIPILSGYIAFSIVGNIGLAAGLVGGFIAENIGAGFMGGIISGFIAGYITLFFRDKLIFSIKSESIKSILLLPFLSILVTGLLMFYVIGKPVILIMSGLTVWLSTLVNTNAILLGIIIGCMMGFDLGGPVNKSAYTFATALLASKSYIPMAAAMAAGMTPPLGLCLATLLSRKRFTLEEREAAKAAGILGLFFITEGAIPFAARDPFRMIPCMMVGSATAGAISTYFGCELLLSHGGIFTMFTPFAIIELPYYILSILIGTIVTAVLAVFVRKPLY